MSQLITLIYGSSAVKPFSDAELVALLAQSRQKNERLNITGMLLYRDGNFLQVLEGDAAAVEALYETVAKDPRHHHVQTFLKRPITKRSFEEWQMGFVNLNTLDPATIPGYSSYLNEPLDSDRFKDETYAHTFLNVFKEAVR